MLVEQCCQALLGRILPEVDRKRSGLAIEIGVGTNEFYFQLFDRLKFKTIAVEPLPTEQVHKLCEKRNITLIESCISDVDGLVTIYLGANENEEDYNFNSLRSDWFGSSGKTLQVCSMSLSTLLANLETRQVTCLKMDVEGMELSIIQQLQNLQTSLLPKVVMFEYGGGGTKESEQGGWSQEILDGTIKCLENIRDLGFKQIILVDLAPHTKARLFDLKSLTLKAVDIFPPCSVYGNIIALREIKYSENRIAAICKPYEGNRIQKSLIGRIVDKVSLSL
jgi:FkbM family methyltransferase